MTKRFYVRARLVDHMTALVEVPDDWTEEDVNDYYRDNGATGEFEVTDSSWEWDFGFTEPCDDDFPLSNIVIEPKEQGS